MDGEVSVSALIIIRASCWIGDRNQLINELESEHHCTNGGRLYGDKMLLYIAALITERTCMLSLSLCNMSSILIMSDDSSLSNFVTSRAAFLGS
jgi:hypothetical protein